MRTDSTIRVALVGLGFGAEFVPIYLHHPNVSCVGICDTNEQVLAEVGDKYQIERRSNNLQDILDSDAYDAVHLVTPIPLHAQQSIAVLESGKHCACTVPMAISLDDLFAIVAAQRKTAKNYMMMETAVYTREFLFVKDMLQKGEFGTLQLLRGAHYQDMENWPTYWMGLPPMYYATHAIAPLLALADSRAVKVHCFGSGQMREELHKQYGNPYPVEVAIFQLEKENLAAEVTRSLFHTARGYTESFNVYAEKATFEWPQIESGEAREGPLIFQMEPLQIGRGRPVHVARATAPDRQDLLPPAIRRFTQRGVYEETKPHLSFLQGGGHGGSHPHLVHEFVCGIIEQRKPRIDAVTAANWTAAGICAHESALHDGERVTIPNMGANKS
jgi:predicted dehydrogenase